MPEIAPLRGWRYDECLVRSLGRVLAPPYDVIDRTEARSLVEASPHNVVQVELPTAFAEPRPTACPYREAAIRLRNWARQGVLRQERDLALYLYEQRFTVGRDSYSRKAVVARLRLVPLGDGVYPHEHTMSGPKRDRRRLLEWTRANVSPIFCIYDDDHGTLSKELQEHAAGIRAAEAVDREGVAHRLWAITHADVVNHVCQQLSNRPVFIADGHHRYETAFAYAAFCQRMRGAAWQPSHPSNYVLVALVATGDPGLVVWPTHRLVRYRAFNVDTLRQHLSPLFHVQPIGCGSDAAKDAWRLAVQSKGASRLAVGTAEGDAWLVVQPKTLEPIHTRHPDHSDRWCSLPVTLAHELLLPQIVRGGSADVAFEHDTEKAISAVAHSEVDLAVLVPPPTVSDLKEIAARGERMPPKSTYFYPKLATGLVIYRHDAP